MHVKGSPAKSWPLYLGHNVFNNQSLATGVVDGWYRLTTPTPMGMGSANGRGPYIVAPSLAL